MKTKPVICGILLGLGLAMFSPGDITAADPPDWRLVWSDEFKQPDGGLPDPQKWRYDTGGNGWGYNELEYYTSRKDNAHIEGGKLVIEARKEDFGKRNYTSARLLTLNKFSRAYGRFEARIKIPSGQGVWPACGEIDIMENIGKEPGTVHGTVHGPGYSGGDGIGGPVTLPGNATVASDFHNFAVGCEPNKITWYMDGNAYFTVSPATLPKNAQWVFNQPKFLILNLAIGGKWPGNPDSTTAFPQRMIVEYVRVYEKTSSDAASN